MKISIETPIMRFRKLRQKYKRLYPKFVRELILLTDVILEVILEVYKNNIEEDFVKDWLAFDEILNDYRYKKDVVKIERPRMKTAELIIDRVISDHRSKHEGLDLFKGRDSNYKMKLAKDIIHFDVDVFLSKEAEWSFAPVGFSLSTDGILKRYDFYNVLFNRIIPSQFHAAYKRFAIKCTEDFSINDSNLFFQYLISDYKCIKLLKISKKELEEIRTRLYLDKFNLRTLIFYERVGKLTERFFKEKNLYFLGNKNELLFSALEKAFKENNPDSSTFPFI